jgi:molecular chaperone DnaK
MLKDHRDKISADDAKNVEEALEAAKKAIAGGSIDDINKTTEALTAASHKLAEAMYKSAATPGTGGQGPGASADGAGAAPGGSEKPKDNVVDAEFVDVDDKK